MNANFLVSLVYGWIRFKFGGSVQLQTTSAVCTLWMSNNVIQRLWWLEPRAIKILQRIHRGTHGHGILCYAKISIDTDQSICPFWSLDNEDFEEEFYTKIPSLVGKNTAKSYQFCNSERPISKSNLLKDAGEPID